MAMNLFVVVLLSAFLGWCFLKVVIPVLGSYVLDRPNGRSSHSSPTPGGGGLSFVVIASAASALASLLHLHSASPFSFLVVAPMFAMPLALVGFLDDRHGVQPGCRYFVQLLTALFVALFSPLLYTSYPFLPLLVILIFAVTALINFANFMDGLDGLVAGCMTVAMASAAIKIVAPWPIWALIGSLFGFLLWNWSPAKVFMGDVGSTFLGAVFAVLVLQASSWPEALALLLVATPFLGDACICVPRRLIDGQRVFQAHRLHLFQRLHQAGWPHARVSSIYIAATAVLAIALLCGGLTWVIIISILELLIGVWLDQQVAVPFAVASHN